MDNLDVAQKVKQFFSAYPLRAFARSAILIQAERPPAGVFYLVEGLVNQYDIAEGGDQVVINVFKPGAFFPMSWAINQTPNAYFFEAAIKSSAHVAPAADVVKFLHDQPEVAYDLLSRVYRGSDGILRRMAHLMGGTAHSRILFELINSAKRFGVPQTGGGVFIPLSENELAKHSGLARETANRALKQLKADSLVKTAKGGMEVVDIAQLEASLGTTL